MKTIKRILFILAFLSFTALLVIALLLPDKTYEQLSDRLFNTPSNDAEQIARQTPTKATPRPNIANQPSPTADKVSPQKIPGSPNIDNTIEVVSGFDWRLPRYVQPSNVSGLISETRGDDQYIRADFHMVRWDKTNPQPNVYDFSELERTLQNRPQQHALLRLETYGRCETPNWALEQLEVTPRGTILFWRDDYVRVLRPYIREVAKLVDNYPQIKGVQIGISDGQYRENCQKFSNKDGWGEFNLKPDELRAAQNQYGLTPDLLESATKRIIDLYADEFGGNTSKLVFNNFDQFSWETIAEPYNAKMIPIANYAMNRGIGNRDGQIEHWMRYTKKVYGMSLKAENNNTCSLHMDEGLAKRVADRYWGTENEEFGDFYWVRNVYGGIQNQPHRFFASSLRALQMRRNFMTIHGGAMQKLTDPVYKTQDFLRYLNLTLGKQMIDTPDAFILLGERYVANFRLTEYPERQNCQANRGSAIRSYGRWMTESSDSKPSLRIDLPSNDQRWGQGFYLPGKLDYEYAARSSDQFNFNLNDELMRLRCPSACNIEVKVGYLDSNVNKIWVETSGAKSGALQTSGDNRIKTATFNLQTTLNNGLGGNDLIVKADSGAVDLILLRVNLLNP